MSYVRTPSGGSHHVPQTAPLYREDTLGCGPDISPDTEDRKCDHTASSLARRKVWEGEEETPLNVLFLANQKPKHIHDIWQEKTADPHIWEAESRECLAFVFTINDWNDSLIIKIDLWLYNVQRWAADIIANTKLRCKYLQSGPTQAASQDKDSFIVPAHRL